MERSGVLPSHISDHYLVDVLLKLKIPKPAPSYVKVRSYKNYGRQRFVFDLEPVPWNVVTLEDDASVMVDRFNARFFDVYWMAMLLSRQLKSRTVTVPLSLRILKS